MPSVQPTFRPSDRLGDRGFQKCTLATDSKRVVLTHPPASARAQGNALRGERCAIEERARVVLGVIACGC